MCIWHLRITSSHSQSQTARLFSLWQCASLLTQSIRNCRPLTPYMEMRVSRSLKIRSQKNFASGLLYIVVGAGVSAVSTSYTMGTAAKMGPGYFPFWLGLILAVIGVMVLIGSLRVTSETDTIPGLDVRSMIWILGAIVLFGLLLRPLGLVLSLVLMVMIASMASHEFGWKGALLNAMILLAICLGAFIYGLNLQLPVWPSFVQ